MDPRDMFPPDLVLPPRTLSAPGSISSFLGECRRFGSRGVLVHGRSLAADGMLAKILATGSDDLEVACWLLSGGEPTLDQVEAARDFALSHSADWVAGVGGGSAMDLGKACAGLLHAPLPARAYHDGEPLLHARTPFAAVPTTAGTGSEATTVTVLTNSGTGVKKSIRHPSFMARLVVLDPELLAACPPEVIAASGMDAFTQALESFLSNKATWLTRTWSLKALELLGANLVPAYRGERGESRRRLLLGSYLAGIALANARLGLVHGLAHPLGSRFGIPHGLICALCLPHVIEYNRGTCAEAYSEIALALGRDPGAMASELMEAMRIRSPLTGRDLPDPEAVIEETLASGSTAANPRRVTRADIEGILRDLFQG
ncbi:iron-containing alcohol dehydrogenase family protein [Verrucomicrobiota bacterium]